MPEASERLSHGEPTFFVRGKVFVMFATNHHGDGRVALWYVGVRELGGRFADIIVVLDTNVSVAAGFNPRSPAARLLTAVRDRLLVLVWCAETLYVLGRISPLRLLDVAGLFRPEAEHDLPLALRPYAFIADPADRVFAALAEAASAALVTNDAHLLDHHHALRVPVLTPRACWEALASDTDIGDGGSRALLRREQDDN